MSVKKALVPFRKGYRGEFRYPVKGDNGPLATLQIMRIVDDGQVEHYTCAMPRCYAIPLILINKHLAFYEAQCHPDGSPLKPSSSGNIRRRELCEYNYLWRLRCRFLQAIFDLNHEPRLDEQWRFVGIHGFLHRMYNRFGHDVHQRYTYWRMEIKERRVPYTTPDVADMNWEAYLQEDMTTSTRINAFLWNRISQGYSRDMKDGPPTDGWRAWRAGNKDREPKLYPDPASPVRELPSELGEATAAVTEQAQAQAQAQARQARCEAEAVAPAEVAAASSSSSETAAGSRCGVGVNEDQDGANMDCEVAALTEPAQLREWASPSTTPVQLLENGQVTITDGRGRLHPAGRQTSLIFEHTAPDNMEIGLVECFFYPKGTKKLELKLHPLIRRL